MKKSLFRHQSFLIQKLREEWEFLEAEEKSYARKRKLIEGSKKVGMAAVKTVLVLAALAGVVMVAAVAPNVFAAFGRTGRRRYISRNAFPKYVSYLQRQDLMKVDSHKDGYTLTPTARGIARATQYSFEQLKINKPKAWDGKWRVVIFDIPEKHKWSREGFREKLKSLGFYHFQKSVFVYPHPCFTEVGFLSSVFNTEDFVHCIETSVLTNDGTLCDHFGLRRHEK